MTVFSLFYTKFDSQIEIETTTKKHYYASINEFYFLNSFQFPDLKSVLTISLFIVDVVESYITIPGTEIIVPRTAKCLKTEFLICVYVIIVS